MGAILCEPATGLLLAMQAKEIETIFYGFGTGSIALGGAAAYNRGEI